MIFDYFYSYGGPELFLLFILIVVTPKLNRWVLRKKDKRTRWTVLGWLWGVSILVAYGDVLYIAWHAKRLCETEAGLHVYRTVETDMLAGLSGIEYWASRGLKVLEMEYSPKDKKRYTIGEDGIRQVEQISDLLSRYELKSEATIYAPSFSKNVDMIRERETGEVMGDLTYFKVYPGWIDRRFLGLLGLSWSPPICGLESKGETEFQLNVHDLVESVVKNLTENQGAQTWTSKNSFGCQSSQTRRM